MVKVVGKKAKTVTTKKHKLRFSGCISSAKSFASKHKIITVIIIIILTFLIGRKLIAWQDYQKFKKAEVYISNIANNIAESNSPDSKEQSNYCYHQARVFVEGPLTCSVQTIIVFRSLTLEQANSLIENIKRTLNNNGVGLRGSSKLLSRDEFHRQGIVQDIYSYNFSNCRIYFSYDSTSFSAITDASDLIISLDCQSPAKARHYPEAITDQ
jgi:hypothetical protein